MDLSLNPTNLIDFTSLFHRDGFAVKKVVGTTYSLHYDTLLMLILALIYGPGASDAIDKKTDKISAAALLAAIRKIKDEELLTVFCQKDKAMLTATGDEAHLLTLLDDFVKSVPEKKVDGGFSSFHSKVWLVAFEKTDDIEKPDGPKKKAFRLIVTSRNLTSNRDFDAVAVFESTENGNTDVVDEIESQVGALPPIFRDAKFNIKVFAEKRKINENLLKKCHSIFSPFLEKGLFDKLIPEHPPINIFSMQQEIYNKLGETPPRSDKFRFFMLNPNLNDTVDDDGDDDGDSNGNGDGDGDGNENENDSVKHFGLHAKLYISDESVIIGSSNFTQSGLTRNREFNVMIDSGIGESDLWKSFGIEKKNNESESAWWTRLRAKNTGLFIPYQPPEGKVPEPSDALNKILQELACCSLKASYDAAAQKLSLSVSPPPKFEADIRWKPLLQGDFKSFGDELRLSWDDIPKENVCRIFVCEVKIDGAKPKEIQMLADPDPDTPESAAKWADIWEKRFNAEIKKIPIEDEINFRMLLVENTEALYGTQVRLKENGGRNGGGGSMPQPPIFERLLELVLDQKLDHDRLKALFEPLQKREKDPSELCKAFGEMANFFGFHPDKEND